MTNTPDFNPEQPKIPELTTSIDSIDYQAALLRYKLLATGQQCFADLLQGYFISYNRRITEVRCQQVFDYLVDVNTALTEQEASATIIANQRLILSMARDQVAQAENLIIQLDSENANQNNASSILSWLMVRNFFFATFDLTFEQAVQIFEYKKNLRQQYYDAATSDAASKIVFTPLFASGDISLFSAMENLLRSPVTTNINQYYSYEIALKFTKHLYGVIYKPDDLAYVVEYTNFNLVAKPNQKIEFVLVMNNMPSQDVLLLIKQPFLDYKDQNTRFELITYHDSQSATQRFYIFGVACSDMETKSI